jgi:IS605 OrfB family transposase
LPRSEKFSGRYLLVPVKFYSSKENKNKNHYDYLKSAIENKKALSYKFLKKENGFWYVQVTFSIKREIKQALNGFIGIDFNYDLIATAETDRYNNYIGFKNYKFDESGKSSEQMEQILSDIAGDVVRRALDNNKEIVIEDLDFTKKKLESNSKVCNYKLNRLQYSKFFELLNSKCIKNGIKLTVVNPAYTSVMGKFKYQYKYGIPLHTAAALVIARRGKFKSKERVPTKLGCVLQSGEASKWSSIYRHRHHWAHWNFLLKNFEKMFE